MHVIEKHLARSGQHDEREIIKERSCFTTAFVIILMCQEQETKQQPIVFSQAVDKVDAYMQATHGIRSRYGKGQTNGGYLLQD